MVLEAAALQKTPICSLGSTGKFREECISTTIAPLINHHHNSYCYHQHRRHHLYFGHHLHSNCFPQEFCERPRHRATWNSFSPKLSDFALELPNTYNSSTVRHPLHPTLTTTTAKNRTCLNRGLGIDNGFETDNDGFGAGNIVNFCLYLRSSSLWNSLYNTINSTITFTVTIKLG
jgi:hypothetical protein